MVFGGAGPRRRWTRKRTVLTVIFGALAAIGLTVWLALIPSVPVSTSGTVEARDWTPCTPPSCPFIPVAGSVSPPTGDPARLTWSSSNATPVSVKLEGAGTGEVPCFWQNATEGDCSFTSNGDYLLFVYDTGSVPPDATNVVDYTVTYWHPWL